MDFKKTLECVISDFNSKKINYALIGGFAMGALGIMRATMDIDFLISLKDLNKLEKILKKYSFKCIHKTDNLSQYSSDLRVFGEIDFIHAFRPHSMNMLKRAIDISVFDEELTLKVLRPEDIIGLKLQALVSDNERFNRELSDIELLMEHFKGELDLERIEEYFNLLNKKDMFLKLKNKYESIDRD